MGDETAPLAVRQDGRVRCITLAQPSRRNALSGPAAVALAHAFEQADLDTDTGAILLEGDGPDFCAGADIQEFTTYRGRSGPEVWQEGRPFTQLFRTGERLSTPLIAAVQGHALGGGVGLVALSHLSIGAQSARLGATEIRLGLFPLAILPALIRAVGARPALAMALTGKVYAAEEALRLGLLTEVVPDAALHERALDMAKQLAARSPAALAVGLAAYRLAVAGGGEQLEAMNFLRACSFLSDDLKEGAQAFLERRPPDWTGR